MRERNIELSKAKELLCGGKIDAHGKAFINWKSLQYEFINVERGDRRKITLTGLKLRMKRILECFEAKKTQKCRTTIQKICRTTFWKKYA